MAQPQVVLVTGASGFLGAWIVESALRAGLRVRGSVRGGDFQSPKFAHLFKLPGASTHLDLVQLDLVSSSQEDFNRAVQGCALVVHAASPIGQFRNFETECVKPALLGTSKILEACSSPGSIVERLVFTSSAVTVGRSASSSKVETKTSNDWNEDLSDGYAKSKILAERMAWKFYRDRKPAWSMCVINPSFFFGPSLSRDGRSTLRLIMMLVGPKHMPMMPRISMGFVDVRDVAEVHVRAALAPRESVDGKRFILCESKTIWFADIAQTIDKHFGQFGYQTPKNYFPDWVLRIIALFSSNAKMMTPRLGIVTEYDTLPVRERLGFKDRGLDAVVVDTIACMIAENLLVKTEQFAKRPNLHFAEWKPPSSTLQE